MKTLKFTRQLTLLAFVAAFFVGTAEKANAQYFSFGKNRVQYKDFNWRYIQSEHFDVYYYDSKNYDLANFTAYVLESSLKQLSDDFGHEIADRIQVIVYDSHNDFSQTNVIPLPINAESILGATDAYKNRITLPFTGNYLDFRNTLHHELEHAVINDMFYGGTVQSRLSGNALQIPLWFNEGMAEYSSTGWTTDTDMFIRDAIINDYLPPLTRLGGYFAYPGGQSFWNFIVKEYGRQKITEIMQTLMAQRDVERTFLRTTGLTLEELSERWLDYYRERYLPEVANRVEIGEIGTLLTKKGESGLANRSPSVSPQGDKVAMITYEEGYRNVIVISAITGEKLKTVIEGKNNLNFEEFNLLNPNLAWSPDGQKIALSAKSEGQDNLAIVDYQTGEVKMIKFPKLDAIGSVAWSPDGNKIAFDGNIGPLQDIFVYNLQTQAFVNVTNDVISDYQPAWGPDSETIYFVSHRGDETELDKIKNTSRLLLDDDLYSSDIYAVEVGDARARRLTITPEWNEKQPEITRDGRLFYVSDENGIPNVYLMNLADRTSSPITNLQTGVTQMSVSADGSRMAVNTVNEGMLDVYMIRSPERLKKDEPLEPNEWAIRRDRETQAERVPATLYVRQMLRKNPLGETSLTGAVADMVDPVPKKAMVDTLEKPAIQDSVAQQKEDTTNTVDFRNYTFDTTLTEDSAFVQEYLDEAKFELENNKTDDGRYVPKDYRLKFSTDIVYAGGNFSTYYGANGITQIIFSDLLGNHQVAFGSNLNFDLRNSNYFLQYSYIENRTNWGFSFFHNASSFQDFSGQLYRFRAYGGSINMQYPFDTFRRIDIGVSVVSLAQNYSRAFSDVTQNLSSTFAYPQVTYTTDKALYGFITPVAGSRYSVSLTGSPVGDLQFASLLGDYRKYFNLGYGYSVAVRGSGAVSLGRDSQSFFMGGMLGWINQRWSGRSIPLDKLGDTFFTLPALPLRGHPYNAIYGDRFSLVNLEFRFPLFAAVLPGPIPFLPLYNITGVAFIDAGMAWGQNIPYEVTFNDGSIRQYGLNPDELNFAVQKRADKYYDAATGEILQERPGNYQTNPERYTRLPFSRGDILIGAGFGLRTIVFGFPLRYDVGWPYYRDGFGGDPIHYITIGVDF